MRRSGMSMRRLVPKLEEDEMASKNAFPVGEMFQKSFRGGSEHLGCSSN